MSICEMLKMVKRYQHYLCISEREREGAMSICEMVKWYQLYLHISERERGAMSIHETLKMVKWYQHYLNISETETEREREALCPCKIPYLSI